MLRIPILRQGRVYYSADSAQLVHHATGEPIAEVSQANAGLIVRDIHRMDARVLESFTVAELIGLCRRAADIFMTGALSAGESGQSFDEYVRQLSATTGMPVGYCRNNAAKVARVLSEMDGVLAGLTRGLSLDILDDGYGSQSGHTLSFFRAGRIFGAVLPSNSPGVHSLWIPALALKAPVVLKPGREEPWTPLRIIESLVAAGFPAEAFGFYPSDHAGANELLYHVDRGMLFGDATTTAAWHGDPRIELHGPGYSKILLGDDCADDWERHVELMVASIAANGGRSCINASAIWTPRHGRKIAAALAHRLARIRPLPVDRDDAELAAFANPQAAEAISATIDAGLREPGALDVSELARGGPRLVRDGRIAFLLPTVVWCDPGAGEPAKHPLANREFLFPYAAVIECPADEMPHRIGPTLVVSAISQQRPFIEALMGSSSVDRLNIGPIPTWRISWDQPHEGNLFELLYRQRAFQIEPAA